MDAFDVECGKCSRMPSNKGSKTQFQKSPKNRPGNPSVSSRSNWKMLSLDTSLGNTRLSHLLSIWVKPTGSTHTVSSKQTASLPSAPHYSISVSNLHELVWTRRPNGVDVWCVWDDTNVLKTQSHLCPQHCCCRHKIKRLKLKINTVFLQLVWWSLCASSHHSVITITLSSRPLGLNSKAEWMPLL